MNAASGQGRRWLANVLLEFLARRQWLIRRTPRKLGLGNHVCAFKSDHPECPCPPTAWRCVGFRYEPTYKR